MVGSSRSNIWGSFMSERAMVRRRFIPPDSGSTFELARSVNCANSSSSSARVATLARDIPKKRPYVNRFSRTRNSWSKLSSCGTTPSCERIAGPSVLGSIPRTSRLPDVRVETAAIIFIVVDLPAPLGPNNPNDSPRCTSNEMPSTATNSSYFLTMFSARITGSDTKT